MSRSFCRALGDSSFNSWNKITSKTGDEIRVATRKNHSDPGEPLGTILSAVASVWLPVLHHVLFDFLRDENRRNEVSTIHEIIIIFITILNLPNLSFLLLFSCKSGT